MISLGCITLLKKEVRRFLNVSIQTVFGPSVISFLTLHVISLSILDRTDYNYDIYHRFIIFGAPGILMMTLLNNAFSNTSSSILSSKNCNDFYDVIRSPLRSYEYIIGYCGAALLRCLCILAIFLVAYRFVFALTPRNIFLSFLWIILGALFTSLLGIIIGFLSKRYEDLSFYANFIIMPLTLFSGTFFSIDVLPQSIYYITLFNPFFCIIEGFRYFFIETESQQSIVFAYFYIISLCILLLILCIYLFHKRWLICE